jgi:hypothetical protein
MESISETTTQKRRKNLLVQHKQKNIIKKQCQRVPLQWKSRFTFGEAQKKTHTQVIHISKMLMMMNKINYKQ